MKLKAKIGAYSSVVGGGVHLISNSGNGQMVGQIAFLCNGDTLRDRGVQERMAQLIANALDGFETEAEKGASSCSVAIVNPPQAWLDVLAERERQVAEEGWTPEHDEAHPPGELAGSAACYAMSAVEPLVYPSLAGFLRTANRRLWPWDRRWWKPTIPRRDLVKAGALILAEIDRLNRRVPRND